MLFKQVVSSFCNKVADLYEQSSRRVSSAVVAYWNPCVLYTMQKNIHINVDSNQTENILNGTTYLVILGQRW